MLDEELCTASLKMQIASQGRSTLDEAVISRSRVCMSSRAGIIECSEDPRGTTLFDEIADDLVIEILNGRPFDLLPNVLLLLRLECQLDEDLL